MEDVECELWNEVLLWETEKYWEEEASEGKEGHVVPREKFFWIHAKHKSRDFFTRFRLNMSERVKLVVNENYSIRDGQDAKRL